MNEEEPQPHSLTSLTTRIVAAFLTNHALSKEDVPALLRTVHAALAQTEAPAVVPAEPPVPAVAIKRSVHPDYLICLEDGKRLKMLKRHLQSSFGMTPDEYRARWGLPRDYPMVAPNYAQARSEMAKRIGLGSPSNKKRGNRREA